ncbi:nitroreductase [Limosilactobacillus sp. STM2_1]|uniref:Nitroreductase n=1 Tax=Limosilactobacillus rudii TaxID=2759755 RepID=A0A7W3UMH7_9LACO|nr:nitroreductase [Limosilactobacillus rudii]MBB1079760.1 nitroreductase [Limosilactobacillus rudii]MBB1097780.1 nitroreductase [Limosilactobacillus rudii]MCD7134861.1 nitroreductase [Limosilactobacillus rudii]
MELQEAINHRHSVRKFQDKPVKREVITKIVQLAQRAPSWVNSQPWQVYCAMDNSLQKIKDAYHKQDTVGNHGQPDLPVMNREKWAAQTQANMKEWRHEIVHHFANFDEAHEEMTNASASLYHSPVILYITIPKASPDWSIFDAGLFAENLMLAATDCGLSTIPTYNSVRFPTILHQILKVPENERFIVGISLGYPTETTINTYRSKRRPVNEILHFN